MTFADVRWTAPALLLLAATVWLAAGDKTVEAHGSEARYVEVAPWQRDRIPRVLAVSRSELGTPGTRRTMEVRDVEGRSGRIPDFPVTRSHPPASWPSAANSSICRTYRKTAGEESRRRSPVANRWMRP